MESRPPDVAWALVLALVVTTFSITRQLVGNTLGDLTGALVAGAVVFFLAWALIHYVRRPTA